MIRAKLSNTTFTSNGISMTETNCEKLISVLCPRVFGMLFYLKGAEKLKADFPRMVLIIGTSKSRLHCAYVGFAGY